MFMKCSYKGYLLIVCTTLAIPKTAPLNRKTSEGRYILTCILTNFLFNNQNLFLNFTPGVRIDS